MDAPPHPLFMRGRLVTAKISPFSAHQCQIKKYGDGILEEVDGFTAQLAKGNTQQASTPVPLLGDLRDCVQPGSPGSVSYHLPSEMRTALRGDLLQEGAQRAKVWHRMELTWNEGASGHRHCRAATLQAKPGVIGSATTSHVSSLVSSQFAFLVVRRGNTSFPFLLQQPHLCVPRLEQGVKLSCPVPLSCCALAPIEF